MSDHKQALEPKVSESEPPPEVPPLKVDLVAQGEELPNAGDGLQAQQPASPSREQEAPSHIKRKGVPPLLARPSDGSLISMPSPVQVIHETEVEERPAQNWTPFSSARELPKGDDQDAFLDGSLANTMPQQSESQKKRYTTTRAKYRRSLRQEIAASRAASDDDLVRAAAAMVAKETPSPEPLDPPTSSPIKQKKKATKVKKKSLNSSPTKLPQHVASGADSQDAALLTLDHFFSKLSSPPVLTSDHELVTFGATQHPHAPAATQGSEARSASPTHSVKPNFRQTPPSTPPRNPSHGSPAAPSTAQPRPASAYAAYSDTHSRRHHQQRPPSSKQRRPRSSMAHAPAHEGSDSEEGNNRKEPPVLDPYSRILQGQEGVYSQHLLAVYELNRIRRALHGNAKQEERRVAIEKLHELQDLVGGEPRLLRKSDVSKLTKLAKSTSNLSHALESPEAGGRFWQEALGKQKKKTKVARQSKKVGSPTTWNARPTAVRRASSPPMSRSYSHSKSKTTGHIILEPLDIPQLLSPKQTAASDNFPTAGKGVRSGGPRRSTSNGTTTLQKSSTARTTPVRKARMSRIDRLAKGKALCSRIFKCFSLETVLSCRVQFKTNAILRASLCN